MPAKGTRDPDTERRHIAAMGGTMNKLIGGVALLLLSGGAGSSAYADGPWCNFYDVSTYNCGFYSYEQCYENMRGVGGWCQRNIFGSDRPQRPTEKKVRKK
jgi:hypothetical protein